MALSGFSSGGGNLPGAEPSNWSASFGGLPQVPSPGATAGSAISSNIGNLGSIYNLGGGINAFQTGQMNTMLGSMIPDYANLRTQQSQNIGQELSGQLPQDVVSQIMQGAAERGIMTGMPGSGNANAAMLRAMGLSSLEMQQMGQQGLQTAIGETPLPQLFNPQSMLVTPDQVQQAQMAANIYAAAPDPEAAARAGYGAATAGFDQGNRSIPLSPGTYRSAPYVGNNPQTIMDTTQGGFGPAYFDQPAVGALNPEQPPVDPYGDWKNWTSSWQMGYPTGEGTTNIYTDAYDVPAE